ncbi:MAG: YbaK/EbsC family protein, partial [bacterium]
TLFRSLAPAADASDAPAASRVATPGCRTIEQVSEFLKVKPEALIKTLIYVVKGQPVAVCIPGHRELNEHKLARVLGAEVQMADDATVEKATGAPLGFAGPAGLTIPVYADAELASGKAYVAGANAADTHIINLRLDRDAKISAYNDLVLCRELDLCPRCGQPMREKRGIEVGHVFKLGVKYSQALEAMYLDEAGNRQTSIMGCYGIGVTRTLQAVIEQSHDANGIIWPASVAPFEVVVLPLNVNHPETMRVAGELVASLEALGFAVLMDDRDERPGFKFKDADLIGFPVRAVVSERSLAEGKIEIKQRTATDKQMVPLAEAASVIAALVRL